MIPSIIYNIPYTKLFYSEKELSEEEFYHQLFFTSHNWKHVDGRIHATKYDKEYVAVTISPYYENFQSQIEEGVWPAVSTLVNKGYLPISSCEGHQGRSPYYVILAFGDEKILNNFIIHLKSTTIMGLNWVVTDTVANTRASFKLGKFNFQKLILEGNDDITYRIGEIKCFNMLFSRNYSSYKFVRITLFDQVNIPRWKWIKFLKSNKDKKKYRQRSIIQLEELFRKLESV